MSALDRYEDILELKYNIDTTKALEEVSRITNWKTEKSRLYVDLVGNPEQNYTVRDAEDNELNDIAHQCPTVSEYINQFPNVYKARVQKLNSGSFFEPHRDHFRGGKLLRVFLALNNTELEKYAFFYDGKIFEFKPGVAYIINTAKVHGSMSFKDSTYHLLLSVANDDATVKTIIDNMTFR